MTKLPLDGDEVNYIRFVLIFKLWKRVLVTGEEGNNINRLAVSKLSPPSHRLVNMIKQGLLVNVLPTLAEDREPQLITRFYMTYKFNLQDAIDVSLFFRLIAYNIFKLSS